MTQRSNCSYIAAKLNYTELSRKFELLSQTEPPGSRNEALAMLEPLREKLLALHRNGWCCQPLAAELKAAGVPATVTRLSECLNHWSRGGAWNAKPRAVGRKKSRHQRQRGIKQDETNQRQATVIKLPITQIVRVTSPLDARQSVVHRALRQTGCTLERPPAVHAERKVSRFVTPIVPPLGAHVIDFAGCPLRTSGRSSSPTG